MLKKMNYALRVVACLYVLFLAQAVYAISDHDQAVSALSAVEGRFQSGAIITAVISNESSGLSSAGTTDFERCYVSGDKIRVDSIRGVKKGVPFGKPMTFIQIGSPDYNVIGYVEPPQVYPSAEALFSRLILNPPLPIKGNEGSLVPVTSKALTVLGFTGSKWLSGYLKETADCSIVSRGEGQELIFGAKMPSMHHVFLRKGSPLLDRYFLVPQDPHIMLKKYEINRDLTASDEVPIYKVNIQSDVEDTRYTVRLLSIQYGPVPDRVFRYADTNGSSYVLGSSKNTVDVVNGKRIQNYAPNDKKPPKSVGNAYPIMFASAAFFCVLLVIWLKMRKGENQD